MRTFLRLSLISLALCACGPKHGDAPRDQRTPVVAADAPLYDRVEGISFPNDCTSDADCMEGGCSHEVCSAQPDVNTTCEVQEWPQGQGASCGCVGGQCVWYR
ncbi:MAG TPA: eight-cysteine-cluster domain-containing protein [Kofleriaceae bacterium]|nr:eight-cysteine-cluster domain-containing protein [Kofleriaceae bacterium]